MVVSAREGGNVGRNHALSPSLPLSLPNTHSGWRNPRGCKTRRLEESVDWKTAVQDLFCRRFLKSRDRFELRLGIPSHTPPTIALPLELCCFYYTCGLLMTLGDYKYYDHQALRTGMGLVNGCVNQCKNIETHHYLRTRSVLSA